MLIEQIIEFELRGPGLLNRICTSTTFFFFQNMKKQKSLKNIVEWIILLFTAKILHEAGYLTSSHLRQITHKI